MLRAGVVVTGLAVAAVVTLIGINLAANVVFWSGFGRGPAEQAMLGVGIAALDGFKVLLPFLIAWSWRAKCRLAASCGGVLFLVLTLFSLMSGLGWAALNRNEVAGRAGEAALRLFEIEADIARLQRQIEAAEGGMPRPVGVIGEALKARELDRAWTASKGCTAVPVGKAGEGARVLCAEVAALREELERGLALAADIERRGQLRAEAERLRRQGGARPADGQAALVADMTGLDAGRVSRTVTLVLAILFEAASGLGLWLATAHGRFRDGLVPLPGVLAPLAEGGKKQGREHRQAVSATNATTAANGANPRSYGPLRHDRS